MCLLPPSRHQSPCPLPRYFRAVLTIVLVVVYLPVPRVFSITQPTPFRVMFSSSAFSLAAFPPYGPMTTILAPNKQFTRLCAIRKSTVDVR